MKKLIIATIGVATISWVWAYTSRSDTPSFSQRTWSGGRTEVVSTGSIATTIKAIGSAQPSQESSVLPSQLGRISHIYVSVGDTVKAWIVLAQVDATDALQNIEQAHISLQNAQLSYQKLLESTTEEDLVRSRNTLASSRENLETLQRDREILLLERDSSLTTSQDAIDADTKNIALLEQKLLSSDTDLAYTTASQSQTLRDAEVSLRNTIDNAKISANILLRDNQGALEAYKKTLLVGEDMSKENIAFIGGKNVATYYAALEAYDQLKRATQALEAAVITLPDSLSESGALQLLESMKVAAESLSRTSDAVVLTLQSSIPSASYAESTINWQISEAKSFASKGSSAITSANNATASIFSTKDPELIALDTSNTIAQKEQSKSSLQLEIEKAKKDIAQQKKDLLRQKQDFDNRMSAQERDIASAQRTIELNELALSSLENGPTDTERRSQQLSIRQSQISLEKAQKALEDYQIIAPFDGIVTAIPFAVGDEATSWGEWIRLEARDLYEIDVLIDQIDIVSVKTGLPATIIFDAYPGRTFTGEIASIDGAPQETSGVVSYTATIILQAPDVQIYSSMTATVEIEVSKKENILILSSSLIQSGSGRTFVSIMWATGQPQIRPITIGISDGSKTEITSGLNAGDRVLPRASSASTSSQSSGFSLGRIFGGGAARPAGGENFGGGQWWGRGGGGGAPTIITR